MSQPNSKGLRGAGLGSPHDAEELYSHDPRDTEPDNDETIRGKGKPQEIVDEIREALSRPDPKQLAMESLADACRAGLTLSTWEGLEEFQAMAETALERAKPYIKEREVQS